MNFARRLFSSSSRAASSVQAASAVAESSVAPIAVKTPKAQLSTKAKLITFEEVPRPVKEAVRHHLERAKIEAKERAERLGDKFDGKVMVQNPFLNYWRPATDP